MGGTLIAPQAVRGPVDNARPFLYRSPSELGVNREEGKKPKHHPSNHNPHSASCLQNGQNDSGFPPHWRKGMIKLEGTGEKPRSVRGKEEVEQRQVFSVTV